MHPILIVDDDDAVRASLALLLKQAGLKTHAVGTPDAALAWLAAHQCALVLQDMNFSRRTSGDEGIDLLRRVREAHPSLPVILITAWGSIALAVEGMRLVQENLLDAYRDGSDLEARANMLSAAAMGATAFQKGLGAIHALSHPVGALYDTHHGLTNAVFMPYVLDFNRETIWDKAERLAGWLGLDGGFQGLLDFVLRLRRDIGVPHTLDKLGVDDARFAEMAAMAVVDPTAGGNPRRLTEDDALELYRRAYDGRLG